MRTTLLVLAALATVGAAVLAILASGSGLALVVLYLVLAAIGFGVCRLIVGDGGW